VLLCAIALAILTSFLVINPSFVRALYVASWFLPVAEYGFSIIKEVERSTAILQDAENFTKRVEKKLLSNDTRSIRYDLIKLQNQIRNRREHGCLIPDWFYCFHKAKQQENEDGIARTIRELKK